MKSTPEALLPSYFSIFGEQLRQEHTQVLQPLRGRLPATTQGGWPCDAMSERMLEGTRDHQEVEGCSRQETTGTEAHRSQATPEDGELETVQYC